jgi:hypothetical protein
MHSGEIMTQELQLDYSKIVKEYQSGKSQRQIANENNTCHKTIKRILSKNNIIIRPRSMLSKTLSEDILRELYLNQKKCINEIAKITNSHHLVVKKNLIRMNVPLRKYKEQLYVTPNFLNRLNKIKDNIERDPRFFYILGAFKGDGHYNIKRNRVEISVIDLDFLEEIKRIFNVLSPETKISIIISKKETDTTQRLYRLCLYSSVFFNKRLHKLLPQTLEEKKFYLQGLYDAEGSVEKNKLVITLSQKNIDDLNLWKSWLNELGIQTSIGTASHNNYNWGVIRILGYDSKVKFYNIIGFRIKRKQDRLKTGLNALQKIIDSRLEVIIF